MSITAGLRRLVRRPVSFARVIANSELPSFLFPDLEFDVEFEGERAAFTLPRSKRIQKVSKTYLSPQRIADTRLLLNHVPTRNVIDIGSNIGYMALNFHFAWRPEQIFCFEASQYNFRYLRRNIAQFKEIAATHIGLSDKAGEAYLAMPSLQQYSGLMQRFNNTGLLSIHGESGFKREKVQLTTLDDWAGERGLDVNGFYIKIDVEGHELHVLRGMRRALTGRNAVQVEINPSALRSAGTSAEEIHKFFGEYGYSPKFAITPSLVNYDEAAREHRLRDTHDAIFVRNS